MSGSPEAPAETPPRTTAARTRWSALAGRPVFDDSSRRIGWIEDAAAKLGSRGRPMVAALVVRVRRSAPRVRLLLDAAVALDVPRITVPGSSTSARMPADEVLLRTDILSHRLIELHTARFVHARDLRLLGARPDVEIAAVLSVMHADAAADVVAGMPADRQGQILRTLATDARGAISAMLGRCAGTARTVMRTEMFVAPVTANVESARRCVAEQDHPGIPSRGAIYLVDERRRMVGAVAVATLIAAPPDRLLTELADVDPFTVLADADLVDLTELMADRRLVAAPVVDQAGALLGLATADDVLGVLTDDRRRRGERSLLP